MGKRRPSHRNQFFKNLKQATQRERRPFLTLLVMIAGAAAFINLIVEAWKIDLINWKWLIIIAPLLHLPKAFAKLKGNQESSITINFALAFREGFLSLPLIAPDTSKWFAKVRDFLKNILPKSKDSH